jgi:hypothetical protein
LAVQDVDGPLVEGLCSLHEALGEGRVGVDGGARSPRDRSTMAPLILLSFQLFGPSVAH